jgi:hypothetical protein
MGQYRAYIIGSDGHIIRAIEIDCADDGAATEQAKLLVEGNVAELWQRERIVGKFNGKLT